jgi:arginyl-tRNA synthetase
MQNEIHATISTIIKRLFGEAPEFKVEVTDLKFGDYSTNVALVLSKSKNENSKEIAQKIIDGIKESDRQMFKSVEIAGPGFINFKITNIFWQNEVGQILASGNKFGTSNLGSDLKVNVEFISANPTGPLTLGNGRGGYNGDVLARVFEAYGAKVTREYYVNDRGAQILSLGHSVLKDNEALYKGTYIDEIQANVKSTKPAEAGERAAAILLEEYIKKTVAKMGIKFDEWFSEKSLHDSGEVAKALGELEQGGLTYKAEDAVWLKTTDFGDDKDRVLVTSDGEYTYFASDIAYHFNKMQRGYNLLFDYWGADHHGYIGRLQAAVDMLRGKLDWAGELKVMIAQLVRLMSNGQEVKMSKRAGTYVTLDELIDEVGPDVTRFFFLDRALDTHMDFDLALAKEKSQKNPVFYIQYAYSRICSILAKTDNEKRVANNFNLLNDQNEIALIKQLIRLPELVEEIVGDYQIQKLAFYARDLATSFHHFYEKCPVIKSGNDNLTAARLELLKATKIVLKNTLDLLGISAPEKM